MDRLENEVLDGKTFGAPLYLVLRRDRAPVPAALDMLFAFVERHGLDTEGLLRVPGNHGLVARMASLIDGGAADAAAVGLRDASDVHNAAALAKQYLRALPEPLCPPAAFDLISSHYHAEDMAKAERVARVAQTLRAEVSRANQRVLRRVLRFGRCVAAHAAANRMTMSNIAMVLGKVLAEWFFYFYFDLSFIS